MAGYLQSDAVIGKEIQFFRGLPEFNEDLREINPKFNNVLVNIITARNRKRICRETKDLQEMC